MGLIRLVDHRVLELAVAELAASPNVRLSLNISPDTTMDPDWWTAIESLMRAHPGVGERLIVEITETVAIQDIDDVRGFVTRLKNFGSQIAIDDFGAGYTSFRNLRKLGVDIVKIDGAFVQNIARSADDRAFVQTLIDLARRLQIKTVAEWVQDEEAAVMLREWGCDYIQGRLIGLASPERPWAWRLRRCCRRRVSSRHLTVVPANAGTHTPRLSMKAIAVDAFAQRSTLVVMGPCVRRDDSGESGRTTKNLLFLLRLFRHALEAFLHVLHLAAKVVDIVFVGRRLRRLLRLGRASTPARGGTNGLNIENVC